MLALVLTLAQKPVPDVFAHPKLPVNAYELPVLGGQLEVVAGLRNRPTSFYGYYAEYGQAYNQLGNMRLSNPDYYVDEQVGYMSWSVGTYPHDGANAFLLQSDGTYKQSLKVAKTLRSDFVNKAHIGYWVSTDGKLLQINSSISVSAGNWILQATFHKDSYDLYLKNPQIGEKKSTVYLPNGTGEFDAMFAPMLANKQEIIKRKVFLGLDAITGAPIRYTAELSGSWSGKLYNKGNYHGRYVNLDSESKHQRIFISDDGVLYKVEEPDHHYISIESPPQ